MSSDHFYHQQWAVFATNTNHLKVLYKVDTWYLMARSISERMHCVRIWSA